MSKIFNLFKNLRRYFFLRIAACLSFLYIFLNSFYKYISLPNDVDEFYYFNYIGERLFDMQVLVIISLFLFPFEAFFRFLIRKFILKKDIKPIPKHENKVLNVLDNIYTLFFILIIISAILYFYFSFFG